MNRVRVGNGCGFWGDSLDAPARLARTGRLDYLTLEYLAELTMSILAVQKAKDSSAGYATDFITVLASLAPILKEQPALKIVTNAGGMNPHACARRAQELLATAGVAKRVAVVHGDDLLPHLDALAAAGHTLAHLDSGEPLDAIRDRRGERERLPRRAPHRRRACAGRGGCRHGPRCRRFAHGRPARARIRLGASRSSTGSRRPRSRGT